MVDERAASHANATTSSVVTGPHTAVARLDLSGALTLALDNHSPVIAKARGPLAAMPADGLDVGADEGGAVGPYASPNKFAGKIETITVELDALPTSPSSP